ncbi:hypothetical protein OH491_05250 [Termitidicoccus mucosus]|uniref:hypothetical protein n=1 Tax=Termitidicoccus mucosus TaxID=1184151 RepID=UPI00318463D0
MALAGLWGWGRLYVGDYDLRAGLTEGGAIRLIKTETPGGEVSADAQKLLVFCDRAELGTLYGKKLRAMLSASPLYREFVILDPRRAPPETLPMGNYDIAVFGNAVRWLPSLPPLGTKRWLVIHPRGGFVMPPKEILMTVWLPKYDSTGGDAAWRKKPGPASCNGKRLARWFCGMDVINQAKGFFGDATILHAEKARSRVFQRYCPLSGSRRALFSRIRFARAATALGDLNQDGDLFLRIKLCTVEFSEDFFRGAY